MGGGTPAADCWEAPLMGYFSNGTEGRDYEAKYCDRCVHQDTGCPVWLAHLLYNYKECTNDTHVSVLELLIPRSPDGLGNDQCKVFHPKGELPSED